MYVHVVLQFYSRSAYFVRFAASQHRFMIKMRQWNHTLRRGSPFQFRDMPDVGADTNFVEEVLYSFKIIEHAQNMLQRLDACCSIDK